MKTSLSTLIFAGSIFLNSCGDKEIQETQENKKDTTKTAEIKNIGDALDYHLKTSALEIYKQGQKLDSLNGEYDLLDKKSDILVGSLKKKYNL